jgi:hypothetical protein
LMIASVVSIVARLDCDMALTSVVELWFM